MAAAKRYTQYKPVWEKEFKFLGPGPSEYKAHCKDCNSDFSIKSGGHADVKRHSNGKKHRKACHKESESSVCVGEENGENDENNNETTLTPEEEIMRAEILQALKVVSSNYSFNSTSDDGERFHLMFPDSDIAKNDHQSKTKVNYVIKHGIAPYVKEGNLIDFKATPFVFKFDETTTSQVKKQYDGYVQYWSKKENLVTSVYCGSLFVGHCRSNDLLHHFETFGEAMKWEPDLLLQVGMDGPNVNIRFERDLATKIYSQYGVSYLNLGTCGLHIIHNAFRKGISAFGFDVEKFVKDTCTFFKMSAARREDYTMMEVFTEIEAKYALKHTSTRWLSMKNPILRILEQWDNLNEYFLKYLPKDSDFSKDIKPAAGYKRIVKYLKNPTSKAELCFIAYISSYFEEYLTVMQANEPMIHYMYERPSMLLFNLEKNFVNYLSITKKVEGVTKAMQGSELVSVDIAKNEKKLETLDIGSKAKSLLSDFSIDSESRDAFLKKCLVFYKTSTKYLISKLPISSQFLKDAQYLHPEKRNYMSSLNAVSRLAKTVATTLKNHLASVFDVSGNASVNDVVDLIRDQWQVYQLLDIPKDWYTVETASAKKGRLQHESYWRDLEKSWLDILPKELGEKTVRVDSYWARVFNVKNSDGRLKFPQLSGLIKSVLTISHGNAGPEQGFSINKSILDVHSTRIGEDSIVALRHVKHKILQVGGVTNFKITQQLLHSVRQSRRRYEEELKENEKKQSDKNKEIDIQENNDLHKIENEIKKIENGIEVAEKAISDGSIKLDHHLTANKLDKLQEDNALIQMGVNRKRKLSAELSILKKRKKSLINSIK